MSAETSCWCHKALSYQSSGEPSLELLIKRMEERAKSKKLGGGVCDVEFDNRTALDPVHSLRARVSMRPVFNASSGRNESRVTVHVSRGDHHM